MPPRTPPGDPSTAQAESLDDQVDLAVLQVLGVKAEASEFSRSVGDHHQRVQVCKFPNQLDKEDLGILKRKKIGGIAFLVLTEEKLDRYGMEDDLRLSLPAISMN